MSSTLGTAPPPAHRASCPSWDGRRGCIHPSRRRAARGRQPRDRARGSLPRAGALVHQGGGDHPVPVGRGGPAAGAGAARALPVPATERVARDGRVVAAAGGPPAGQGPHAREEGARASVDTSPSGRVGLDQSADPDAAATASARDVASPRYGEPVSSDEVGPAGDGAGRSTCPRSSGTRAGPSCSSTSSPSPRWPHWRTCSPTELDWASLGLYAVLFLAVWLAWTTFMLYGNVAGSRTHVLRLLIGMFGLGVMAASVPGVAHTLLDGGHEERAVTVFAVAYIATRVYGAQSWRPGEVLLDFPVAQHTLGVLPWVVSLWTHPPVTVALWALGVALDLWLVLVVSGDDMLERYSSRMDQLTARGDRARDRSTGQGGRRGGRPRRDPASAADRMATADGGDRRGRGGRPAGRRVRRAWGPGAPGAQAGAGRHRPRAPRGAARGVRHHRARRGRGAGRERGVEHGARVGAVRGRAGVVRAARRDVRAVRAVRLRRACRTCAGMPWWRGSGLALHCVVTGVIATVSVGLASVVEHGSEPLGTGPRWLLCGAVAAYFLIGAGRRARGARAGGRRAHRCGSRAGWWCRCCSGVFGGPLPAIAADRGHRAGRRGPGRRRGAVGGSPGRRQRPDATGHGAGFAG